MDIAPNEVRVDLAKNRLYLTLRGTWTDESSVTVTEIVKQRAKALRPGFSIINDISQMKAASPNAAAIIKACQEWLSAHGAKRVIRVIDPSNMISGMQFRRASQEVYRADVAGSVREAEEMLRE